MSKPQLELRNYFATIHDLAVGNEVWESRPGWLEFAPNNICNLRCIMCEQSQGVPLQTMDKEDTARLLDEVLPHTSLWTPSALSEPMLANINMVIEKCKEHDVFLNMYSNLTKLDGQRFTKIMDRIQTLWVSFDSPHKREFEILRAPADFETVVQHIEEVLPLAATHGIPVNFVAVAMKDNLPQLAELVDFLADRGAVTAGSALRVQPMLANSPECEELDMFRAFSEAEIQAHLDAACERAQARGMNFEVYFDAPYRRQIVAQAPRIRGVVPDIYVEMIETVRKRYPHYCYMAATYMKIEPSGDVFPCCRGPRDLRMGNTGEQSVEEIWNGPKYRAFRQQMMNRDYPEVCRGCDHLVANPDFDKSWLEQPRPQSD